MFGPSGGGGVGGGGGNQKRGKGGGGTARNNHNHQNPQEIIHQIQPVPVMAPTQPMIQPIFQTFHQPPGMPQLYGPIQLHYMPTGSLHPAFPNLGAAPQTQYVFPRAQYASSVPVNLQTLGAFSAIPHNLTQNHTTNPMAALRNSHGPLAIATGTPSSLHTAPPVASTTSSATPTTRKKRAHALEIIDPETRKNIMEPWNSPEEVKKDTDKPAAVVEKDEKKKSEPSADESANKVDCQMQTDVPVKVIKQPVKTEEKKETCQDLESRNQENTKKSVNVSTEPMPKTMRFQKNVSNLNQEISDQKNLKTDVFQEACTSRQFEKQYRKNYQTEQVKQHSVTNENTKKNKKKKNKNKKLQDNENVQPSYEKVTIAVRKPSEDDNTQSLTKTIATESTFKEVCCTHSPSWINFIVDVEDLKPTVSVDSEIEGYCTDNELQTLIQEKSQDSTDVVLFSRKLNFQKPSEVNFTFGISAKYRRYSLEEMHGLRTQCTAKPNLRDGIMKLVGRAHMDDKKRSSSASKTLESKQMIRVNLSLKENIKLNESSDAWKPNILEETHSKGNDLETIVKKIRGFLNRLTEENFDTLSTEATKLTIQTPEEIESVMILVFEKAIGEPNFAHLYAKFCHAIFAKTNHATKKENFIRVLVEHTEQEFISNVDNANAIKAKLEPINERLSNCTDEQQRAEILAELDEQEYLFRRRAWGTVRLIGELFNIDILKPKCVMECLQKLLDPKCEEKLEYLCKLLATVGKKLEKTQRDSSGQTYNAELTKIINSMHEIVSPKKTKGKQQQPPTVSCKLSSRVHFMLLDSIDLKRNQWQKGCITSPNVLMRKQVTSELESKTQKQVKTNKIVQIKPKTNFPTPTLIQTNDRKKAMPIDSNKLNFNTDGEFQLGNSSQFMWRTAAGTTVNSTQNVSTVVKKEEESEDIVPSIVVTEVVQVSTPDDDLDWSKICQELTEAFSNKNHMECMKIWQEKMKNPHHHNHIVFYILSEYLISDLLNSQRETIAKVLIELHKTKCISLEHIQSGFNQFKETANDLFLDVPLLWQFLFQFISPFLQEDVIKFEYIWSKEWSSTVLAEKFLLALISYFTNDFGPKYLRNLWKKLNLNWNIFFKTPEEARAFINVHQCGFIENENSILPDSMFKRSYEDVGCSIKRLIIVENKNLDHVVDFVNGNVKVINSKFINVLTQSLCDAAAVIENSSLDDNIFVERCIPILRRYIDVNEEYELECIRAIDTFVKNYEHPQDLFSEISHNLTEHELISEETLKKWRELP